MVKETKERTRRKREKTYLDWSKIENRIRFWKPRQGDEQGDEQGDDRVDGQGESVGTT